MGCKGSTVGRGGRGRRVSMMVSPWGRSATRDRSAGVDHQVLAQSGLSLSRPRGARENYKRQSRGHQTPFVGGRHHGALTPQTKLPGLLFRKPRPFPAARGRAGLLITGRARLRSDTPRPGAPPTRVSPAHFRAGRGCWGRPAPPQRDG